MAVELSVGALVGIAIGLAVDLFKKRYELRLSMQRDIRDLIGEISSNIAKMIHAVLWVTYRSTRKTVSHEVTEYDKEIHQLIGALVASQAKLAHASPENFKVITPWISKCINLTESADEALGNLAAHKTGAADEVSDVNSSAMKLLKAFQENMLVTKSNV